MNADRHPQAAKGAFQEEQVLQVRHWTDRLFSFVTTRDRSFRFSNGHFTMLGLRVEGKPLIRAYSIASANHEEHLEFLSIKVPDGPLTSRLQHLRPDDTVIVGRKPTGTLVADYLLPGRRLYLLATGTGLAPFLSIVRDPDSYERFEEVILVHGVRKRDELAYREMLTEQLPNDELLGELVRGKLRYYPTVTREAFTNMGRITKLIESGRLFTDLGVPPLDADADRVMVCGSPGAVRDLRALLDGAGFHEGSTTTPGSYVVERAFVEQ
ncbi:MAG TPA: ferredoxin--NADP reductase [Ramlibacter sp.]|uniref:ferredoxin--NADP reductase n=1 Tax=Ramlibacter sp. TaxID=1917967 RepID=UPI002BF9E1E4|nr:ferredoxin--NADP reductase [Ramlibacter sp.]HVZ42640.1 ferredoxin--NADP reductase [Ramlibacter sp.]